jgi:hypothetical protein
MTLGRLARYSYAFRLSDRASLVPRPKARPGRLGFDAGQFAAPNAGTPVITRPMLRIAASRSPPLGPQAGVDEAGRIGKFQWLVKVEWVATRLAPQMPIRSVPLAVKCMLRHSTRSGEPGEVLIRRTRLDLPRQVAAARARRPGK